MSPENNLNLSAQRISLISLLILGMTPLVGMGVDLIAPSLPAISRDLQVSHTISKNLVAIYLFGYALGSFVFGFLCDAWGRRKFVIGGLALFVVASLLPTFFPNTLALLSGRFFQGIAIASYSITARSVLSDMLDSNQLVRIAPMVATMWGIGPIIGPVIGGYLQYYFGWQACFYFFALLSAIFLVLAICFIPETHFNRQALNIKQISDNFMTLVRHRMFMGSVLLMGIFYSLLIVFNTLGPFLIQMELGKSAIYFGHLALFMGLIFLVGTTTCRRLVKHFLPENIILTAVIIASIIGLISLIAAYIASMNIWVIVVPSLLMFFSTGIVYPAAMGKGLALFRHIAGSSSAITQLINILTTSLTAFVMSFINAGSAISIAWIYLCLLLSGGLVCMLLIKEKKL